MSSQPNGQGRVLGLLTAFTLGMIAMAAVAIVVFLPYLRPSTESVGEASDSADPNSPKPTATLRSLQSPGRGAVSQSAPAKAPQPIRAIPTSTVRAPVDRNGLTPPTVDPSVTQSGSSAARAAIVRLEQEEVRNFARRSLVFGGLVNEEQTRVMGKVTLEGKPPADVTIRIGATDPCIAEGPKTTRHFVVGRNNELANVLVHVVRGLPKREWPAPAQPLLIDFTKCELQPQVSAIQAGQSVIAQNYDSIMHNVHLMSGNRLNRELNMAMMPASKPAMLTLEKPDAARIKCDVHPWEIAYINVFDHPFFAVTDEGGNFSIEGLPPGEYTLRAEHRKAGAVEHRVTVRPRESIQLDLTFAAPVDL